MIDKEAIYIQKYIQMVKNLCASYASEIASECLEQTNSEIALFLDAKIANFIKYTGELDFDMQTSYSDVPKSHQNVSIELSVFRKSFEPYSVN